MNFAKFFHKSNSSIHQLQGNVLECTIEKIRGNKVIVDTGMRASFVCFQDELSESSTMIVISGPFTARKVVHQQLRRQGRAYRNQREAFRDPSPLARIRLAMSQQGPLAPTGGAGEPFPPELPETGLRPEPATRQPGPTLQSGASARVGFNDAGRVWSFIPFLASKPYKNLEIEVRRLERTQRVPAVSGFTEGAASSVSTRATNQTADEKRRSGDAMRLPFGGREVVYLGGVLQRKRSLWPSIIDSGAINAKSGKKTKFVSAANSVGLLSSTVEPESPSHQRSRTKTCLIGVEERRSPLTGEFTCSAPKSMEKISKRKLVWTELSKLWRTNVRMKGFILNSVNGGFAVAIAGYIAFLPKSLCINKKVFIGQWRQFAIIGMNPKIANIVVKEIRMANGGRTFISKGRAQRTRRIKDRNSKSFTPKGTRSVPAGRRGE